MEAALHTIIDLQKENARLRAALKQISVGYENQNIGHKEFRIKAKQCADGALAERD